MQLLNTYSAYSSSPNRIIGYVYRDDWVKTHPNILTLVSCKFKGANKQYIEAQITIGTYTRITNETNHT